MLFDEIIKSRFISLFCEIRRPNTSTFDNGSPILSNKIDFKTGKWKMTRFVRGTLGVAWFQTAAGTNESINTRNVVRATIYTSFKRSIWFYGKEKKKRKKNERKTRERTLQKAKLRRSSWSLVVLWKSILSRKNSFRYVCVWDVSLSTWIIFVILNDTKQCFEKS